MHFLGLEYRKTDILINNPHIQIQQKPMGVKSAIHRPALK